MTVDCLGDDGLLVAVCLDDDGWTVDCFGDDGLTVDCLDDDGLMVDCLLSLLILDVDVLKIDGLGSD